MVYSKGRAVARASMYYFVRLVGRLAFILKLGGRQSDWSVIIKTYLPINLPTFLKR